MSEQIVVNGVISGLLLAVLALSFSVVYLPCRVFHIALGAIFAVTPYVAMAVLGTGAPWWVAVLAALLAAVGLSLLCEAGNHRRLERRGASHGAHIIASLGVFILITQLTAVIWGNDTQVLRHGVDQTYRLGPLIVTRAQGMSAVVSLILLAAVYLWLRYSGVGLRFRALADNPTELALCGYNVNHYRLLAFAVSGALGGAAALMTAYDVGFDPHGGLHRLLLAVVAVIIGGRASFLGPVLGGLLLGILRAQVVWHFSARWQDVFAFLLLAAFLYVRPNGICGQPTRLEAQQH